MENKYNHITVKICNSQQLVVQDIDGTMTDQLEVIVSEVLAAFQKRIDGVTYVPDGGFKRFK